jgi:hypothetical protein
VIILDKIIKEIITPSKRYKAEIYRRKDNLLAYNIYKWLITDDDVREEYNLEEGFWAILPSGSSLTNDIEHAEQTATEELRCLSGEDFLNKPFN